jgi:hypothetical protein
MMKHRQRPGHSGVEDAVQRTASPGGHAVGKTTLVQVQMIQAGSPAPAAREPAQIQEAAAAGVSRSSR